MAAACDVQEHQLLFLFFSWALEVADGCGSALLAAGTRDAVVLLVPSRFNPKYVQREGCRRRSCRLSCVLSCFVVCRPLNRQLLIFIVLNLSMFFGVCVWFSDVRFYLSRREICFGREATKLPN